MRFRHEQHYDATPAEVHAMLADESFRARVTDAQEARTSTVDITPDGGAMTVRVDQTRGSEGIPAFAQKIVGDSIRIVQVETWADASEAALDVTIPGKPGRLTGTISLAVDGSGTVKVVDGDLRVNVPLMGGKLERLVADLLGAALDQEGQVGKTWLAGRG